MGIATTHSGVGLGLFLQEAGIQIPEPKHSGEEQKNSTPTNTNKTLSRYPVALVKLPDEFHRLFLHKDGNCFLGDLLGMLEQAPAQPKITIHTLYGVSQLAHCLCQQTDPKEIKKFRGPEGVIGFFIDLKREISMEFGNGWTYEDIPDIREPMIKKIKLKLGK